MNSQLTYIAAQQHIADLHRSADHHRLLNTSTPSNRHVVPGHDHTAAASVFFLRLIGRRLV